MRFGITTRLFIAILATAALTVLLVSAASRWNFERGFLGYLNELAVERMDTVLPRLVQAYSEHRDWSFLGDPARPWYKLLRPMPGEPLPPGGIDAALPSDLTGALSRLGLLDDRQRWVAGYRNVAAIERELRPYTDFFRDHPELLNLASGDLAGQWEIDEAIVRAAQALMRRGDGTRDERLLKIFEQVQVTSIGKGDLGGDLAGTKERNDAYARQGRAMASKDKELTAHRSNNGAYVPGLWARGFDVGSAVSHRQSEFGPGQAAIRDSLRGPSQRSGYNRARDLQYRRTIKLQQALDGLTKQVFSGRDAALSAFGTGLGASSTTAVRARAAAPVPLTPQAPARVNAPGKTDTAVCTPPSEADVTGYAGA